MERDSHFGAWSALRKSRLFQPCKLSVVAVLPACHDVRDVERLSIKVWGDQMKCLQIAVIAGLTFGAHAATAGTVYCNPAAIAMSSLAAVPAVLYPSTIAVAGAGSNVNAVNVQLFGLTHTFPDDIDVLLVGPTGASLIVQSDVGAGDDVAALDYTISDSGATLLPDAAALVAGTFRPTNVGAGDTFAAPAPVGPYGSSAPAGTATLSSTFAGTNPNGSWRLYVVDDAAGDAGTYAGGWCLDFVTTPVTLQTFEVD